jgi:hypothetical protein
MDLRISADKQKKTTNKKYTPHCVKVIMNPMPYKISLPDALRTNMVDTIYAVHVKGTNRCTQT